MSTSTDLSSRLAALKSLHERVVLYDVAKEGFDEDLFISHHVALLLSVHNGKSIDILLRRKFLSEFLCVPPVLGTFTKATEFGLTKFLPHLLPKCSSLRLLSSLNSILWDMQLCVPEPLINRIYDEFLRATSRIPSN